MDKLLEWNDELGIGYYPVNNNGNVYDKAYFDKYVGYEELDIGKQINQFRINFTNTFCKEGAVLDVGIGSGFFLSNRGNTYGYDVNPTGIDWLYNRNKYVDVYLDEISYFKGLTFFDSFEHIENPWLILRRLYNQYVIMSIPIFKDKEHVLKSKHFRPDEHYHYFTHQGLVNYMSGLGFSFCWMSNQETLLGRDEIYTYVFFK